ncbi:MAG: substrate-binding domain-containing protein [Anaerolineae bacterium]|nr:substrate-binding domain-containing protein [Anaerolineae bacterium]
MVNRKLDDLDTDYALGDLRDGLRKVIAYLCQLGHQRIAYLAGSMHRFPVRERLIGYRQGLEEHHIAYDPALVTTQDSSIDSVFPQIEYLMKGVNRPPTAIFTYNDLQAVAVLRALHDLGYGVPADVSVVGYDDLDFARHLTPPLTSMTQPAYEIGQAGAQILIDRLRQPDDASWTLRQLHFKSELVVRQSTGPARRAS